MVRPFMLKPEPVAEAAAIFTALPPVLVMVSDTFLLDPAWTLPKLTLDGFATRAPGVTPVPESVTVTVELEDVIVTLPETAPPDLGAKTTLKGRLCPAVSVAGRDRPLKENPLPLAVAALMVTLELPEFERVADCVEVFPTVTLPKLSAPGATPNCPAVMPEPETATVREVFLEDLPVYFP